LQIKRGKANCSSFERTWPHHFISDGCLLIIISFVHPNLFNKRSPCLPPSIPFSDFRLPRLHRSLVSVVGMARDSRVRFCKEEAPQPRPRPTSSALSAAPTKRVRFRGDSPAFLFNHNGRSTLLTVVKPRSTWVLTSKTSPTNPNDPIDQVNAHVWSNLGQMHGQTLPKP
jgi:hypothetical protein